MFNSFLHAIRTTLTKISHALRVRDDSDALEAYLNASIDAHDLEARQRHWDRSHRGSTFFH